MSGQGAATLRILERADREILNLSRTDKGAVYEFQHKFRHNPHSPGLQLKQLKGDSRLRGVPEVGSSRCHLVLVDQPTEEVTAA